MRQGLVATNDWALPDNPGLHPNGVQFNGRNFRPNAETNFFSPLPQPGHILLTDRKTCGSGIRVASFETDTQETYTAVRAMNSDEDPPTSLNLPKPVMGVSKNAATIIELLRVWFFSAHNSTDSSSLSAFLSTRPVPTTFAAHLDGAVIASFTKNVHVSAGESAETLAEETWPVEVDLTDGAGHGVLVATDKIYLSVVSESTGNTNDVICRMLYRYKTVGITEYVGIVQSQN